MSILEMVKDKNNAKAVQKGLNLLNYGLKVDGDFGPKSMSAFKRFKARKKRKGFTEDQLLNDLNIKVVKSYKQKEKPKSKLTTEIPKPTGKLSPNERLLVIASKEIGVKEYRGKADNPRVRLYHAYSTKNNKVGTPDSIPWCSSFLCFVAERAGLESTNSKAARSWSWGKYKKISNPIAGDIVVFYRKGKNSGLGHVGFVVKVTKSSVYVLGGNQSDAVNIKRFSRVSNKKSGIVGFYRLHNETIAKDIEKRLNAMGEALYKGHKITNAGKVV